MSVKCKDILYWMNKAAPFDLSEDWDNVGLLLGSKSKDVNRVMICLDVTMDAVNASINEGIDLIISHHPLIFKPLKRIIEDDPKGELISKLIINNISVAAMHTNYDAAENGLNHVLAKEIGLCDLKDLNKYKEETVYKLTVFVPEEGLEKVRSTLFSNGAGHIGNYSDCTFSVRGRGTFRPLEGAKPHIGSLDKLEVVNEYRLETIIPECKLEKAIGEMLKAHPYEEAAYDLYKLNSCNKAYGLGKAGRLDTEMPLEKFIHLLKDKLNIPILRVSGHTDKVKTAAVFCGGFDGNISGMKKHAPDVLITGDIKYNQAVELVGMGMCIIDAGHFHTEKIMVSHIAHILKKDFNKLNIIQYKGLEDIFRYF